MSVGSSMVTAISGLDAHGQMLGTITDNIVNANTNGFKSSRTEFQNVLAQNLGGGSANQMGRGVDAAGITGIFTQGSVTKTDRSTDVAINGNGFFVLKGDGKGVTYTRDGSFRFDKDGWLTNLKGSRVQAYTASPEGNITGKLDDVRIPFSTIPAKATKDIELHVNLDARMEPGGELDLERPGDTAQFTTALQVFDSIGNAHAINMYFNKTSSGTWEWHAMTDGGNLAGGEKGIQSLVAKGSLEFDSLGKLESADQEIVNSSFANGAISDQELYFDFGDPLDQDGTGQRGTTQYGSKNSTFRQIQDGWAAGTLADTQINQDGIITGVYTNGLNKQLGQIAVARFEATERLQKVGENQFGETVQSGQALIGKAQTNGRGEVLSSSLESSNVDMAKEFVDMIRAQRGFQASAKSISTSNEMLDEVINIKT